MEKTQFERNNKEKENYHNEETSGPTKLVFKQYGGNVFTDAAKDVLTINSPLVQSLIFYEQSKRGWGPKLYGLLDNIRIEEFVECHTLRHTEAFTPEILKDTAKAFARFHSLKLPINQECKDTLKETFLTSAINKEKMKNFLESDPIIDTEILKRFNKLMLFPFEEEEKWINSFRRKIQQRKVLCTMDSNYLNRLVREEKPSDPDATRVLIIDFDASGYSDRGFDLAGHFISKMFDVSNKETMISGFEFPSESEQMSLLSAYLEECEKLFDDFDKNSLDSLENLLLETDLNLFIVLYSYFSFGLVLYSSYKEEPAITTFISPGLKLYNEKKQEFLVKYSHLISN